MVDKQDWDVTQLLLTTQVDSFVLQNMNRCRIIKHLSRSAISYFDALEELYLLYLARAKILDIQIKTSSLQSTVKGSWFFRATATAR